MIRRAAIRLLMPIGWRLGRRPSRALARFAQIEADSGWQFLQAIDRIEAPETRAMLFHNVLEEKEHSAAFANLASKLNGAPMHIPPADRSALIDEAESLPDFLAYVHAGELDVAQEFGAYSAAANVAEASRLFEEIQIEEEGHEDGLWTALIAMVGDEKAAQAMVRKARRRRWWEAWKQLGRNIGDVVSSVWLGALYLLFGPLILVASRRRLIEGRPRT